MTIGQHNDLHRSNPVISRQARWAILAIHIGSNVQRKAKAYSQEVLLVIEFMTSKLGILSSFA
jgi:hypothetical protein